LIDFLLQEESKGEVTERILPVKEPEPAVLSVPEPEAVHVPAEAAPVVEQILPVKEPEPTVPSVPEPVHGPAEPVPAVEQISTVKEPEPTVSSARASPSGSDLRSAVEPQEPPPVQRTRAPERPRLPKRRSLIHYPTPEEAQQEAEEEQMVPKAGSAPLVPPVPSVASVSLGQSLSADAPAETAHVVPPGRSSGKTNLPKKRSVIHYPTPEESEQEAQEEDTMTVRSGTDGRKERSWVSRAWTGFFGR
jgi:hypothetical protein